MYKKSLFLSLLMVTFLTATSQKVLTPLEVAKIRYVTWYEVSPSGNHVAYTVSTPADPLKENLPARNQLYLLDLNTGMSKPFVTSGSMSNIRFRPDSETITFLSRRAGDSYTSLYEIPLNGGESVKLLEIDRSISSYDWSPDGTKIAYLANEDKIASGSSPKLPYEPEIYEENLTFRKAFVLDMNSGSPRSIDMDGHFSFISWSPDGTKLAVVTAPSPLVDDSYMAQRISILSYNNFQVEGVVDHSSKLGSIIWSPDSRNLAFLGGEDVHDPTPGRLLVVSATGGKPKNLKPDYDGMFEQIEWNEQAVIQFVASRGTMSGLGTIKPTGSSLTHKFEPNDIVINSAKKSAKGSIIMLAESTTHPTELFIIEQGGKEVKRLTDSNPWLNEYAFAEQEVVSYKARDGRVIEGIVIHPLNEVKGTQYPMITVVHGGPESHYNNGWLTSYSMAGQVGAAMGFAVFYPNYRGSTGRGVEFAKSSQGDLAGSEFDDVVDGVDHLIASGMVDKDKVGVTGGSYGGYATAWMSTYYSDRFAAGVMFVGISNNLSKWGTTDIPEELYLVHARKRVWEDYEWWLKRSPVYHVDKAKTPLLIMHGKEDTRVYPGQSMELYRHIKTRTDTPVRLVYYPGEGHGNRNATARLDYNLRSLRWFEKYLKDKEVDLDTSVSIENK